MNSCVASLLGLSLTPPGVSNAWAFFIVGALAVVVFGAAKAGFGGGVAMVSTPLMIYACGGDSQLAVAIMLPLLIAADYVTLLLWWGRWDWRNVAMLLPGAVLGVAGGAALLVLFGHFGGVEGAGRKTTNDALSLAIGLIALGFVGLQLIRALRGRLEASRPAWWQATAFGSAAGVTSTLAHLAGPVATMYLLPQQMPKGRYVATTVLFFWFVNQIKLVPYMLLDLLSAPSLMADLMLIPAVAVGAAVGMSLHKRINEVWFTRVIYVLLGGIGLDLCIRSSIKLLLP